MTLFLIAGSGAAREAVALVVGELGKCIGDGQQRATDQLGFGGEYPVEGIAVLALA